MSTRHTVRCIQGATFRRILTTPWNLTGYTVAAQLRDNHGVGTLRGTFTCTLQTNPNTGQLGNVELLLSATATAELNPRATDLAFDVKLTAPNGDVSYVPRVWLDVEERVTV